MFENKLFEGIYYTRFIASYNNVKGKIYRDDFKRWLRNLTINGKAIPESVINEITNLALDGKMELEMNCRRFFN